MTPLRTVAALCLGVASIAVIACGGDDETTAASSTTSSGDATASSSTTAVAGDGSCAEIEEVDVPTAGQHSDREFTAVDYDTNPPTGGDHNPTPLDAGTYYADPPALGEAVHLLEHGAVIGWTNGLSKQDLRAVEDEFNEVFKDGYYQLAVVENPDLDVPFALSAWGAMQKCDSVDTSVIRPFVEQWYASPKTAEGGLACEGDARTLPNC